MIELFKILSIMIFIYLINGCGIKFKEVNRLDIRIPTNKVPKLSNIQYLIDHKSIVFKWKSVLSLGLDGILIYRTKGDCRDNNSSKKKF